MTTREQLIEDTAQKFQKYDLVRIADDLGPHMRHFQFGCDAIVIGSYADQYGTSDRRNYSLFIKGSGELSWYDESQMTLIESGRKSTLDEWKLELEAEEAQKSDLDWIFSHGDEVLSGANGATLSKLASCLGIDNLWGSRGEGVTYYLNSIQVLAAAEKFLRSGDKHGWLDFCQTLRKANQ